MNISMGPSTRGLILSREGKFSLKGVTIKFLKKYIGLIFRQSTYLMFREGKHRTESERITTANYLSTRHKITSD